MTVTGYGFNSDNIKATVDGVDCEITNHHDFSFSCLVASKDEISVVGDNATYYQGSNGLRREIYNSTGWVNWNSLDSYDYRAELATAAETPYNEGTYIANKLKGWFIPPATTSYRFYQACDDYCRVSLGNVSGQVEDPIELMRLTSWSNYRDWYETRATTFQTNQISEWVNLTEGEPYFLEGVTYEGGGGDHFSIAVEIEQNDTIGHHHSMREV